jgi:hypothetical protein
MRKCGHHYDLRAASQATLAHSQVSFTLDTYSHVLPALQAEAATQMQQALG